VIFLAAKTGGGKSTVSKMMSICYAKYPEIAQFIIDPVGEFAKNARGNFGTERFRLNLQEIYNNLGKEVRVYNVRDLVLDTWELFENVLYRVEFLRKLSIDASQNREKACNVLREELEGKVTLTNLWTEESFMKVMDLLHDEDIQKQIFKGKEQRERLNHFVNKIGQQEMYMYDTFLMYMLMLVETLLILLIIIQEVQVKSMLVNLLPQIEIDLF